MRLFVIFIAFLVVYSVSGASLGSKDKSNNGKTTKSNSGKTSATKGMLKKDSEDTESEVKIDNTEEETNSEKIERLLWEIQELLANTESESSSKPEKPSKNDAPSKVSPKPPCRKPHPPFDFPRPPFGFPPPPFGFPPPPPFFG